MKRMAQPEETYGQNAIISRMQTKKLGRPLYFFESTDSTNVRAKAEVEKGAPDGTLIVADMQTAGRGRRGREWESPAGANIYFTLILKPKLPPDKASMLTLVMAMAVERALEQNDVLQSRGAFQKSRTGIKWPNDIVINGRKVCGILTEMSVERGAIRYVVIGVGINVGSCTFAEELAEKATSLEAEWGQKPSRSALLADIMKCFEEEYESFLETLDLSKLQEWYNQCLVNCDREVCVLEPTGEWRGIARGINETGELLVELPDGSVREIYAGEVSVRGIYGYV